MSGPHAGRGRTERILRIAVRAYPRAFRARHGDQILRFLTAQRAEARYRGTSGAARFWTEVTWDTLRNGFRARLHETSERTWRGGHAGGVGLEVRTGMRGLSRTPGFTMTVALTLGLGIGAATAVYSIADWVLLRAPSGVAEPDRLVTVRFQREDRPANWYLVSQADVEDLSARTPALSALAGVMRADAHVLTSGSAMARRLPLDLVGPGWFDLMGVHAALGRLPRGDEADPRVVLISDRLWRSEFGADPSLPGRAIMLNGQPFTVVGVAPPAFRGETPAEREPDLWAPMAAHAAIIPDYPAGLMSRRDVTVYLSLNGRLRAGMDVESARAQLAAARGAIVEEIGTESSLFRFVPVVEPGVGSSPWVRERARSTLRVLGAAVALLLLLGCANAGNMLLTRSVTRARELAVRRALGAARRRIAGGLIAEGAMLGLFGGVAGAAIARVLLLVFQGERVTGFLPTLEAIPLDGRVLAFAATAALATGVIFSLAPAFVVARASDATLSSGTRVVAGGGALSRVLVAAQVALSLALVVGAGLLVDTVQALGRVELGFDPAHAWEATLDPGTQGYGPEERDAFWRALLDGMRGAPGVRAAGLAYAPLHGRVAADNEVRVEGAPEEAGVDAAMNAIGDGFLAATGVELVAGRDFRPEEVLPETPFDVVLVSRSLATELFGGAEAAVGRSVAMAYPEDRLFEIVGVVEDIRGKGVRDDESRLVIEPLGQQWNPTWATLYARGDPGVPIGARMREAVRALDPTLPPYDVQRVADRVASSYAEDRLLARLTAIFGVVAMGLAALGLYGTLTWTIAARTRELGVRVALGAGAASIRSMILRQAVTLVSWGLLPGLALAMLASRLVRSRLWGVEPFDLRVYGAAASVLLLAAAVASWIPAWRATRVDPVRALRSEG